MWGNWLDMSDLAQERLIHQQLLNFSSPWQDWKALLRINKISFFKRWKLCHKFFNISKTILECFSSGDRLDCTLWLHTASKMFYIQSQSVFFRKDRAVTLRGFPFFIDALTGGLNLMRRKRKQKSPTGFFLQQQLKFIVKKVTLHLDLKTNCCRINLR